MAYWCAARLLPHRERLALHCLGLAGFEVYLPRLRVLRGLHGRKIETQPPLFPGYVFLRVVLQWYSASKSPGVASLIMNGLGPAHLADDAIAEIRSREHNGLIDLPKPLSLSRRRLRSGDPVCIVHGPFIGRLAVYAGMKPQERVEVLLCLLGREQRVIMAKQDIEAISKADVGRGFPT
jgi:transcription antitermination factor NusG